MLVTLKDLLPPAADAQYAVPCFNVFGSEEVVAILAAATEARRAVILACNKDMADHLGVIGFAGMVRGLAEVATVPVWKGRLPTANLGAPGALFVSVPKGEGDKLKTVVERTDPLVAPLTKGQRVGTLKVTTAAGTQVADVPLVVQQPVELAGVMGRAWDALRLWIK